MRTSARSIVGRSIVLALALASPGLAVAAGSAEEPGVEAELRRCLALADAEERLSCFESAARDRLASPAAPAAAASPAGDAPAPARQDFGADSLPGRARQADDRDAALTARIERLQRRPHGERVLHLSNGQVWTELEPGRTRYRAGGEVRIEPAAFGGYMLYVGNGRGTRVRRLE